MFAKTVVNGIVQNQVGQRFTMQIVNVVRLEVDVKRDFPVGLERPRVLAYNFVSFIAAPPQLGLDIGECCNWVNVIAQSDRD